MRPSRRPRPQPYPRASSVSQSKAGGSGGGGGALTPRSRRALDDRRCANLPSVPRMRVSLPPGPEKLRKLGYGAGLTIVRAEGSDDEGLRCQRRIRA